jgi:hypothetical protein
MVQYQRLPFAPEDNQRCVQAAGKGARFHSMRSLSWYLPKGAFWNGGTQGPTLATIRLIIRLIISHIAERVLVLPKSY